MISHQVSPALLPSRITVLLLMAGGFCCPMSKWVLSQGYLSYSDLFFFAALTSHITNTLANPRAVSISIFLIVAALILALSGIIDTFIDSQYSYPLNSGKLVFSMTLFPLIITLIAGVDSAITEKLLVAWLAGGTFSALIAFASSHEISILGFYDSLSAKGARAEGLAYHANAFAYACALLVPVAVYFWGQKPRLMVRLLVLISLSLLLYGIYSSGSRGSLLAMLTAMLAWPLLKMRGSVRPQTLLALMGLALVAVFFVVLGAEYFTHAFPRFTESAIGRLLGLSSSAAGSNVGREQYIHGGWERFSESPVFGSGYFWLRGAHMHILGIMDAAGLFGLSGLIFWGVAISCAVLKLRKIRHANVSSAGFDALFILTVSGLINWLVGGAFQPALLDRNGYILIGILFALDANTRHQIAIKTGLKSQTVASNVVASLQSPILSSHHFRHT
jgi:hypothetical protein